MLDAAQTKPRITIMDQSYRDVLIITNFPLISILNPLVMLVNITILLNLVIMVSCAEISTEQLKAYSFLTGVISRLPIDNRATYYIQHYGLKHVNESLGTFNFVSDEIETRFPDSQIHEKLEQLGLTPNANSDYIGMFSAFGQSNNPKYQNAMDFDKARELAGDCEFMGNKAYLDRIHEDRRNGIRYVTGDDEDPSYGPVKIRPRNENQI
ncbi:hypothetical protein QFC19_002387 [Naganishia cerealis]|uniref:Uncharacterized protein n=1 Tax=Naganishia cerealis TaxID=610337 RepID=A0ACC2WAC5_9TREE|nr:hypothetical protein QFC19_002387 [Naganishia cerealis]